VSIELSGSVEITYDVRGTWALSLLTEGWTDAEKQALIDGKDEARAALIDAHCQRTLLNPDQCDEGFVDIRGLPERTTATEPESL
jgi:hypothetical protein